MNAPPFPAGVTPLEASDFLPLPAKSLNHAGVTVTRSSIIRAARKGVIKTRLFRQPGSTKGRRYILRESLDAYIRQCMADVPFTAKEAA